MLTVSPSSTPPCVDASGDTDQLGVDPDCRWQRLAPGLHVCTDRDGHLVAAGKACFTWARAQVLGRSCPRCDDSTAAGADLCHWCVDDLARRDALEAACEATCFGLADGVHQPECWDARLRYDGAEHDVPGPVWLVAS